MKHARTFAVVIFLISVAGSACGAATPTQPTPQIQASPTAEPNLEPTETATPTARPVPSPSPTAVQLQLELIQSQTWTDRDGNVRVNVLFRNPYEFPVQPKSRGRAELLNGAGEFMRDQALYFLDGISGGIGFLLPGETIAANACFTCEREPITEEWDSVEFLTVIEDATDSWEYSTEVEANVGSVSFAGDSPLFDIAGTVKNNSDTSLNRISVRVFAFDQAGNLVGAAEASAFDVAAGATVNFDGYGIGEAPDGSIKYEVSALGVKY